MCTGPDRPLIYLMQNRNREEKTMRTHGDAVKGHEIVAPHIDREAVKQWTKRTFSKERIVGAIARVLVLGYMGTLLFQVFQTY